MSLRDSTNGGSKSPLHVHVAESTPVHVHVKKRSKSNSGQSLRSTSGLSGTASSSSYRRPTSSSSQKASTSRRSNPTWIPPPARSGTGKLSWQGPTHRLEVHPPFSPGKHHGGENGGGGGGGTVLRLSDLSDSSSDVVRTCERKIDSLMSEVGHLKSEVDLQKSLQHAQKTEARLSHSKRLLAEKECELQDARDELLDATMESDRLRQSMSGLQESSHRHRRESDGLLKKLIEVEMDGAAAARQAAELKRTVANLEADKRASAVMNEELEQKKDDMIRRLSDFDTNNKTLRRMLRSQQKQEEYSRETQVGMERRIADMESTAIDLRSQLRDRVHDIATLQANLDTQKEQCEVMRQLRDSAETARQHLQDALSKKDIDLSRQTGRLTSVEASLSHEKSESDYLRKSLSDTKERLLQEKEALKKATRHHKQRASDNGSALEVANISLAQKTSELSDSIHQCDDLKLQLHRLTREKSNLVAELTTLKSRLDERESELQSSQTASRATSDGLSMQLSAKSHQVTSLQAENERLKVAIANFEERIDTMDSAASSKSSASSAEIAQLRGSIKQYESLIVEYKVQLEKCRQEIEDSHTRVQDQEMEARRQHQTTIIDNEKIRSKLQSRVSELEALPDVLKSTESRLRETQERLLLAERQSADHLRQASELTAKMESQSDLGDTLRDKWQSVMEENRTTISRAEQAERRLLESERRSTELMEMLAKKEEALQRSQGRLDELLRDRSMTSQKLESSLSDARIQVDQLKERSRSKERSQKSRIDELELKLQRATTLTSQLKVEKEEAERRLHGKVFDLQDRLDQEKHNTRSMENYVSFLKASYSNVFGDSTLGPGNASTLGLSGRTSSFASPKKVH